MDDFNKSKEIKIFNENGKLNEIVLGIEGILLKELSADLLEIRDNYKSYLLKKDKTSIPGLEKGVDSIGSRPIKFVGDESDYYEITKNNIKYYIDINGNYYGGLTSGVKNNNGVLTDVLTGKQNILEYRYSEFGFLLEEWCDSITKTLTSGIEMYTFHYPDKVKFAILDDLDNLKMIDGKFDNIELFHNSIKLQTNNSNGGYDSVDSTTIKAEKDEKYYLYDKEGILISRKIGIEKSLGKIIAHDITSSPGRGELVTFKENKFFLYYLSENSSCLIGNKSGADSYKAIKDYNGWNRYWLLQYGEKYKLYAAQDNEIAIEGLEDGFDKFNGLKHVYIPPKDHWDLEKNVLYADIEDGDKKYLLDVSSYKNYSNNHIGKVLKEGFDSIEQIFPIDNNYNSSIFGFSPLLIENEKKLYLFDENGEIIEGIEDAKIEKIIEKNYYYCIIEKKNKLYLLKRRSNIIINDDVNFDKFIEKISKNEIKVEKDGETFLIDINTGKRIPVGENIKEAVNKDILNKFLQKQEEDGIPF